MLVEREHELAVIERQLLQARAGTGTVVVIEAPAGQGKSRLMTIAGDLAREAGMQVLGAHGSELERDFAFGVAIQLFEPRWGAIDDRERERLMNGPARHARHLLNGTPPEAGRFADVQAYAVIHGLFWLCHDLAFPAGARAHPAPVLMLVDDAHWADRPSMRFLAYLAQRIADLPIALVAAARAGEVDTDVLDPLRPAAGGVLTPRSLSDAGVATLVRAHYPDADSDFCHACSRATNGNPFLLRELIDLLSANGTAVDAAAAATVATVAPRSVMHQVLRRLDAMGADVSQVARAVAVLGEGAPLHRTARLAGLDPERAAAAADALARVHLFDAGRPLCFVHPLIAAAVRASISPFEQGRLHVRAARMMMAERAPAEQIAAHLLEAPPAADATAVAALRAAARKALARGAAETAARMLRRAMREQPESARPPELVAELARAESAAGDPDAVTRIAQALAVASEPRTRGELAIAHGQALYEQGRYAEAARALRGTLVELSTSSEADRSLLAELEAAFIAAAFFVPELHDEVRRQARALLDAPATPTSSARLDALAHVAMHGALRGEKRSDVVAVARRAWADGELLAVGSLDRVSWPLVAGALLYVDELERALAICDTALAAARSEDSPAAYATASYCRAWPLYEQGRVVEALADAHAGLDARPEGWGIYLRTAYGALACCHLQRGDLDQAETALTILEHPDFQESVHLPSLLDARAQLRLAQGRSHEALRDALMAGERLQDDDLEVTNPGAVAWRSTAALAALAAGDSAQAANLAAAELDLALDVDLPRLAMRNLRILGLAEGGQAGLELLASAVGRGEAAGPSLDYIAALIDLGSGLRRARRRSSARDPLRRALDLARHGGATVLAARAETELAATGARARRRPLTGVDALTPSERRVADLAARGLTTRQVAEALFVTPKTVEFHLRHIYQKLDINSRRQLADQLGGVS